jgi:hypothetical protein
MHEVQYLFLPILISIHTLIIFLCKDQLHYNLLYKILFGLNFKDHFFNSLFPRYLGNKRISGVVIAIPFFSYGLNPLENILIALQGGSINTHLHIAQDVEHNSYLSSYFGLFNFTLAAQVLALYFFYLSTLHLQDLNHQRN